MSISGKMSMGIRSPAPIPMMQMRISEAMIVYGRLSAKAAKLIGDSEPYQPRIALAGALIRGDRIVLIERACRCRRPRDRPPDFRSIGVRRNAVIAEESAACT